MEPDIAMGAYTVTAAEDLRQDVEVPEGIGAGERLLAFDSHSGSVGVKKIHAIAKLVDVQEEHRLVGVVVKPLLHVRHGGHEERSIA